MSFTDDSGGELYNELQMPKLLRITKTDYDSGTGSDCLPKIMIDLVSDRLGECETSGWDIPQDMHPIGRAPRVLYTVCAFPGNSHTSLATLNPMSLPHTTEAESAYIESSFRATNQ